MVSAALVPVDQRFAQLIQQFGLTKNSFAMSLGKTASVVQHLIDGRNKPGFDLLCKVFEIYPNVSRDWLLLGRGPMLVSGEPAPRNAAPAPVAKASPAPAAPPLEPIDLSDVERPPARRANGSAGAARLQPAEIAATLALAAAIEPAQTSVSAPGAQPTTTAEPLPETVFAPTVVEVAPVPPVPAVATATATDATQPRTLAAPPSAPEMLPASPAAGSVSPEVYVAAALNAQQLHHQLALAELRNQHLLEQQNLLREMLAMARQSMV